MGYYHVNDTGKGVIIKDFDNISEDYKMPPIDYIKEYFESKRGIGKKNLEWLASMDVYHQLAYLAQNDYRLSYIVSNLDEKTPEAFCKNMMKAIAMIFLLMRQIFLSVCFVIGLGILSATLRGFRIMMELLCFSVMRNILLKLIIRNLEN